MHQRELALCHARCPVFLYSAKAHTVLPLRASSVVFLESSLEKNNTERMKLCLCSNCINL